MDIGKFIRYVAGFTMIAFMGAILLCNDSANRGKKISDETCRDAMMKKDARETEMAVPCFSEKEAANQKMGKKRKFPILWAVLGIGIASGLVLMLGKKKNNPQPPQPPQPPTVSYSNGVLTVAGVRYEFLAIPAGEFQMGSSSPEADADELPVHTVRISRGFWLGKTEVTQGLWNAVMESNPANFKKGNNYPVEMVSWNDVLSFIARLNQLTGINAFRLPTEAEWEYACRAGTTTEHHGDVDLIAWYGGNSGGVTHPVAEKQANGFGLHDMSGNVFEWCQDWFGPYPSNDQTDPTGPSTGTIRICRGGSFYWNGAPPHSAAWFVRSAGRGGHDNPNYRNNNLGLRLAASSAGN